MEKLRHVLSVVTAGVQESKAQQKQQHQLALAQKHKRKPYSPWLAQPFLKVRPLRSSSYAQQVQP